MSQVLLGLTGAMVVSGHRVWMPPLALPAAALLVVVPLFGLLHAQRERQGSRVLVGLLVSVVVINFALPCMLVIGGRVQIPSGCEGGIVATDWVRNQVSCQFGGAYGEVIQVDHDFIDFLDLA